MEPNIEDIVTSDWDASHGAVMTKDLKLQKEQLDQIRRERAQLAEQIRMSQQTIERSQELIRQMDELLAKAEHES